MATTVDESQPKSGEAPDPDPEPWAPPQGGAAIVDSADGQIRFVRARRRSRRRPGFILFLTGLGLIAIGLTILFVGFGGGSGSGTVTATPTVAQVVQNNSTVLIGYARANSTVKIVALGTTVNLLADKTGTWTLPVPLYPGQNRFTVSYTDGPGHRKSTLYLITVPIRSATTTPRTTITPATSVVVSTVPTTVPISGPTSGPIPVTTIAPVHLDLGITSPAPGARIVGNRVFVIGRATPGTTITGAGLSTAVDPTGAWSLSIKLVGGANFLQFTATAPNATPLTIGLLVVSVAPPSTTAPTTALSTTTTCCPPDTVP